MEEESLSVFWQIKTQTSSLSVRAGLGHESRDLSQLPLPRLHPELQGWIVTAHRELFWSYSGNYSGVIL